MREPRPADVLEAVRYVTGYDPLQKSRFRTFVSARRLGVAALREICELTYAQCARELGYKDHTTVVHHARGAVDPRLLKAVLQRVNDRLEAEASHDRIERAQREAAGW